MKLQGKLHVELFCDHMKVDVNVYMQEGERDELLVALSAINALVSRLEDRDSLSAPPIEEAFER